MKRRLHQSGHDFRHCVVDDHRRGHIYRRYVCFLHFFVNFSLCSSHTAQIFARHRLTERWDDGLSMLVHYANAISYMLLRTLWLNESFCVLFDELERPDHIPSFITSWWKMAAPTRSQILSFDIRVALIWSILGWLVQTRSIFYFWAYFVSRCVCFISGDATTLKALFKLLLNLGL